MRPSGRQPDQMRAVTLERNVAWKSKSDVAELAGRAVRLRFVIRDADLYSYRFVE